MFRNSRGGYLTLACPCNTTITIPIGPDTIEAGSGTAAPTMLTVPDMVVNGVAESSVPPLKSKFYSSFILSISSFIVSTTYCPNLARVRL